MLVWLDVRILSVQAMASFTFNRCIDMAQPFGRVGVAFEAHARYKRVRESPVAGEFSGLTMACRTIHRWFSE